MGDEKKVTKVKKTSIGKADIGGHFEL